MSSLELIGPQNPGALPDGITLSTAQDFDVVSVNAQFNGAAANSDFLPCLALYSPAGTLIGRYFPSQAVAPGDSAVVTYSTALSGIAQDFPGAKSYHLISAASTNAAVIKSGPGAVVGYMIGNTSVQMEFVKLYDKSSTPTVGTDVPLVVLPVPTASAANVAYDFSVEFQNGIGIATTLGVGDGDSTAVGANDLAVTIFYV